MTETVLTLHESPVSPVVLDSKIREIVIDASFPLTLALSAPKQSRCAVVVRIRQAGALTIRVKAEAGCIGMKVARRSRSLRKMKSTAMPSSRQCMSS